uniref:Uncharacterized protein n=1 Tax=Oryza brachyantha TaxID=4533 RepID=J3LUL1_ORYBR
MGRDVQRGAYMVMYGSGASSELDARSRIPADADRPAAVSCWTSSTFGDGMGATGVAAAAEEVNVETMLVLPLPPVAVVADVKLKKLSDDLGGGGLSRSMIPSSICTTLPPIAGRCAGCSWMHQKLTCSARSTWTMSMSSPGSFLSMMAAMFPFSYSS